MQVLQQCGASFVLALLISVIPVTVLAAAGEVTEIEGQVQAQRDDEPTRQLDVGDPVFESDTISTGSDARVEIRFRDDTVFNLGPDSSFAVENYDYGADTEEEPGFAARIIKGSFRFVTGLIGSNRPEGFKVNTAVATIGIRGTHVVGEANATSATVILLAEEDGSVGAVTVSNEYGSVEIDQAEYGTEIPDQYSPPSPPQRMQINTLQNITRSLQSIQRLNLPSPSPSPSPMPAPMPQVLQ